MNIPGTEQRQADVKKKNELLEIQARATLEVGAAKGFVDFQTLGYDKQQFYLKQKILNNSVILTKQFSADKPLLGIC